MAYTIHIKNFTSQPATISICNAIVKEYRKNPDTELIIQFEGCGFIYPDYAVLLVCTIKYLEKIGFKVGGEIFIDRESKVASYLAKMNFFEILKVEFPFDIEVVDDESSVQIQRYTRENQLDVLKSILKVLRAKSSMHDNVYTGIDYCLNEILDNVLNHSEQEEGWVVAQYFENLNSIRLIVADSGIGIHKSLNLTHDFTEELAVRKCIEEGMTNGKGQGHGLYATATFARLNKGWLSICSGEQKLNVTEDETIMKSVDGWNGTYVYLRINTNVEVDYTEFTSRNFDYKKQIFEDLFG